MSLPDDTCLALEIDVSIFLDLSITLVGGLSLSVSIEPGTLPNLSAVVQGILGPLNAALGPLMPFFRILDVVVAIIEFCKAVPDALGPPPDPTLLLKKLRLLLRAAAKLAALMPQISIPIMIAGICKVIIAALLALIEQLEAAFVVQAKLDLARGKAAALAFDPLTLFGAAALEASIDCAQINLDLMLEISVSGMGPLNKFLDLLNTFLALAGLPELLSIDASASPAALLAPLRAGVAAIENLCASLPV